MADDFTSIRITADGLVVTNDDNESYRLSEGDTQDVFENIDDVSGGAVAKALENEVHRATLNNSLDVDDTDVRLTATNMIVPTSGGDVWLNPIQVADLKNQLHDTLNQSQQHAFTEEVEDQGHDDLPQPIIFGVPVQSVVGQGRLFDTITNGVDGLTHSVRQLLPVGSLINTVIGDQDSYGGTAGPLQGIIDAISGVINGGDGSQVVLTQAQQVQGLETQLTVAS